jgi:flagellar FliL protein
LADATADTPPKRKGGLVRIILMVLGAALLLGGGFGGGYFYSRQTVSPADEVQRLLDERDAAEAEESGPQMEKVAKEMPAQAAFLTQYYEFPEPLTTNLKGSRRFLQIGVGVSTQYDETVIRNVETHTLALRSDMLAVISGFGEPDIEGKAGRDALADALRDAINVRLEKLEGFGGVEGVFFSTFVLQ